MEAKDIRCAECGQIVDSPLQFHPNDCCVSFKAGQRQVAEEIFGELKPLEDWLARLRATLEDKNHSRALVIAGLYDTGKLLQALKSRYVGD